MEVIKDTKTTKTAVRQSKKTAPTTVSKEGGVPSGEGALQSEIQSPPVSHDVKPPVVFAYVDFRKFLQDFYNFKKTQNPTYSLAVFAQKAGLQTRNYLKRVMDGERALTLECIPKFCQGLGLTAKERTFFEALVHFNQNKDPDTKKHYFSILHHAAHDEKESVFEILKDKMDVCSFWYILPVRELVLLPDFQEDGTYISKKLKNKINKKQAEEALAILIRTGLLLRDDKTKKLKQANAVVRYSQEVVNLTVREFHNQMLDRTKQAMDEDEFDSWNVRALTVAVPRDQIKKVHGELDEFVKKLNINLSKFVDDPKGGVDTIIQLNAQVFELTEGMKRKGTSK